MMLGAGVVFHVNCKFNSKNRKVGRSVSLLLPHLVFPVSFHTPATLSSGHTAGDAARTLPLTPGTGCWWEQEPRAVKKMAFLRTGRSICM